MTFGIRQGVRMLRDPALDEEFERRGVVVMPFLTPDEVAYLRTEYRAMRPDDDFGLTVDYMRPDRGFMRQVHDLVQPLWERHFPEVFVDHRPIITTFVTKHPGERSNMFLHEDRSYADERVHRTATLWIPLVDVGPDIDNGVLYVIPRSHLLAQSFCGTGTPELFRQYEDHLQQHLEPLTVPAGWAAFYDSRTLHTSPANMTDTPREAIACSVVPNGAGLLHVIATTRRHRRIHRVDDQFFVDVHPHSFAVSLPPEYPVIEEYDENIALTPEDVAAALGTGAGGALPRVNDPAAHGTPPWLLARLAPRLPRLTEDLPITAGYLPPPGVDPIEGVELEVVKGIAGVLTVDDGARVVEPFPPWGAPLRPFLGRRRRSIVLLVDAGAEVRLHLAEGVVASWRVDVIDAALFGATWSVDGHDEGLDESRSLVVATGIHAQVANLGPGVLALLLTVEAMTPAPAAPAPTGPRPLHRRALGRLRAYASRARARLRP